MGTPPHDLVDISAERIPLMHSGLSPTDNWQGLADARERRKRQNRINQRKHREAKRREQHIHGQSTSPTSPSLSSHTILTRTLPPVEQYINSSTSQQNSNNPTTEVDPPSTLLTSQPDAQLSNGHSPPSTDTFSSPETITLWFEMPWAEKRRALIEQFATFHNTQTTNCPMSNNQLTVIKVNAHRAFVSNMVSLGITWEWMEDDSRSPFSIVGPVKKHGHALPQQLLPTALQRTTPHHTWIDLFPCPRMRDNLIRAGDEWDDEELCSDIMGFWDENPADSDGLIIWGEPSDPRNWEIQPGFVGKWGWVVRGCDEIIRSTNRWRAMRGERPLFSASFLTSS
ncbi:hypothetical protein PHISCL_04220 [Aspergillus sclerotialis]|uniref:BZIP domain-containing protein n=1 Tax=Aspergillus sclerotialis TaxID=2070753 RepID=A0A3A2ZJZ0_9EURO|nr:hypothetical protein PHISCL_04220 [Aspergillus sclerotialis]